MLVTPAHVARFLGRDEDPSYLALAGEHLPVVTAFVRAYTRGVGFDPDSLPNDDLGAVIVSATARLTNNPEQSRRVTVADYAESPAVLDGFTLPELAVLNLYRRRAA